MDLFTSIGPLWRFSKTEHRWCHSHPPPASASHPLSAPSLFANALTSWEDHGSVWTNHRDGWHRRLQEYIRHPTPYRFQKIIYFHYLLNKRILINKMSLSFYCAVLIQNFQSQIVFQLWREGSDWKLNHKSSTFGCFWLVHEQN